jgi:hypothetical protein
MKFLAIYTPTASARNQPPEHYAKMGAYVDQSFKNGTLVATGGVGNNPAHAKLRARHGTIENIDGPYSEAKEMIGGFAILEARDLAHCKELVREFLSIAGDGESEIFELGGATLAPSP